MDSNGMHQSVVFQCLLGAFLFGIGLASFLSVPATLVWLIVAAGALAMVFNGRGRIAGMCFLVMAYGIHMTMVALDDDTVLYRQAGQEVSLIGYVDGEFELTKMGGKFPLRVGGERVLVVQAAWPRWQYGQVLHVSGTLSLPGNSTDFDYVSYLRKDNIRTIVNYPDITETTNTPLPWSRRMWIAGRGGLYHIRDVIVHSITRSVSEPAASYLAGILVGARQSIPQELTDAFARTGTSHILAISGYNITIVAQVIMLGLLQVMSRRRALGWALTGIFLFTLLVGAGTSVVRAAIMGSLVLVASHLGRMSSAGTAVLLSGALMCWFNPLVLRYDVGFQLSFLAIIGLVYLEPLLRPYIDRGVKSKALASVLSATLSAQLITLPLLLYYFGNLSVYALPTNLLVLPLVPLAMALGLLTALAGLVIPALGTIIGIGAWAVASYQLAVVDWFSHLPLADLTWRIDIGIMAALYTTMICWYFLYARTQTTPIATA